MIYAGSKYHKFNLWVADAQSDDKAPLLRLMEKRYAGVGRGYAYVSGRAEMYGHIPQIVLADITQLSDFPPEG